MNTKTLRNYAITHFVANLILAVMCIKLMYGSEIDVKELISWVYLFAVSGLLATFISKKKLWEYFISFVILLPIIIPIMYVCIKGMIPPELILFDAFGIWYIYNKFKKEEDEREERNESNEKSGD